MRFGRLGLGRRVCAICGRKRAVVGWCDECRDSYDRAIANDDGTVLASIVWAAKRARRFAKATSPTPTTPVPPRQPRRG